MPRGVYDRSKVVRRPGASGGRPKGATSDVRQMLEDERVRLTRERDAAEHELMLIERALGALNVGPIPAGLPREAQRSFVAPPDEGKNVSQAVLITMGPAPTLPASKPAEPPELVHAAELERLISWLGTIDFDVARYDGMAHDTRCWLVNNTHKLTLGELVGMTNQSRKERGLAPFAIPV